MGHFRQELGTCVDCKPTSIVPTRETSLRDKGACSVVVSASNWQADGPGLIRADAAAGLIYFFKIKIDGQRLTLLNVIGTIRYSH